MRIAGNTHRVKKTRERVCVSRRGVRGGDFPPLTIPPYNSKGYISKGYNVGVIQNGEYSKGLYSKGNTREG